MKPNEKTHKFDNDALDLQIDRLNSVIQSMMNGIQTLDKENPLERYSTDFLSPSCRLNSKRNRISVLSLESEQDLITTERDWIFESVEADEEIMSNIEGLLISLDRAMMVAEDYRSSEVRKNEFEYENMEENKLIHEIKCSLSDMYKLISDAKQIITETETNKSYNGILKLGDFSIDILIEHNDLILQEKSNLSKEILTHLSVKPIISTKNISPEQAYINQLENEIEELKRNSMFPDEIFDFTKNLKHKLEETYEKSSEEFSGSFNSDNSLELTKSTMELFPNSSRPVLHLDLHKINRGNNEVKKMKEELEWQINEMQITKNQYKNKLNEMQQQQALFQQQANLIKAKTVELEKDKENFEKEKEKLVQEKKDFEEKQSKLKNDIRNTFSRHNRGASGDFFRPPKSRKNSEKCYYSSREGTPEPIIDEEADALYEELQKAQALLQTANAENADSIVIKINRIKTQLSNLRSAKALNHFQAHSNSIQHVINTMEKQFETRDIRKASPVPRKAVISTPSDFAPKDNKILNGLQVPKNLCATPDKLIASFSESNFCRKSPIPITKPVQNLNPALDAEIETLKKHLRLKEIRLKEKEKEIFDKEIMLQKTWMKEPDADQLIPMVQKELIYIQSLKQNLELKQKDIERDQYLLLKKLEQVKKKEEFLSEKENKIDSEIEVQKREISEKTEAIYQLLTSYNLQ
ncbi:unnamed protein product [Blepharisma stoltei]|uniref:Uncharacterized protein n=1 Tax=Blepharisma stoltei TaxID=1481888 RepID=A0AAU9JFA6_9CILI|nr:unnamed protein product [Blepharisma stoltei]